MTMDVLEKQYLANKIDKKTYIEEMYKSHDVLFQYSQMIKDRDIQKIEITDDCVQFTTREHGIKLLSSRYDQRMAPIEILNFRKYEPEDHYMIDKLVQDNDVVFDIGGNIGFYSIALAKSKHNLQIHSFEPIPKTYEVLVANAKINGANINIHNIGLSNENTQLSFFFYKEGSGNASAAIMDESKETVEVKCNVERLDDFFPKTGLDKLDFIKCDVEGAELFAFQGGVDTIKNKKPIVFTEMLRKWAAKFDYHPNDIINLFKEMGYQCYYTDDDSLIPIEVMDEDTIPTNFFFLHGQKHSSLIHSLTKKDV